MIRLLTFLIACSSCVHAAPSSSARSLPQRQTEILLADILGPGKARLFLRTFRRAEHPLHRGSRTPEDRTLWERWHARAQERPLILPGYRMPETLTEEIKREALALMKEELPAEREITEATLFLAMDVAQEEVPGLRRLAWDALGLDSVRGDTLTVSRFPVSAGKKAAELKDRAFDFLLYAATASTVLLLAYLLFAARRLHGDGRSADGRGPAPDRELPRLAALPPHHSKNAAVFLENEPVDGVLYVLRTTEIDVAARIFENLSPKKRYEAAHAILFSQPVEAEKNLPVEVRLLSSMAAEDGGEALLERLLLRISERTRGETLARLYARSPMKVRAIKSRLISMRDLAAASPDSLRSLLSSFSCEEIALSLYEAPDEVRKPLLGALPEVVREVVEENLRYQVPDSYEQVQKIRSDIYARWKRLELYGRVRPLRPQTVR